MPLFSSPEKKVLLRIPQSPPDPPYRPHVLFLLQMHFSTSQVRAPRTPCQDSTHDPPCDRSHTACWLPFPTLTWSLRVPFFQNCALPHAPCAQNQSDTVPVPPSFWTDPCPSSQNRSGSLPCMCPPSPGCPPPAVCLSKLQSASHCPRYKHRSGKDNADPTDPPASRSPFQNPPQDSQDTAPTARQKSPGNHENASTKSAALLSPATGHLPLRLQSSYRPPQTAPSRS